MVYSIAVNENQVISTNIKNEVKSQKLSGIQRLVRSFLFYLKRISPDRAIIMAAAEWASTTCFLGVGFCVVVVTF